jgi:hypothetical protein
LFLPLSPVFFLKLTTVSLAVLGVLASVATVVTCRCRWSARRGRHRGA